MSNVLITGGAGYLGTEVVRAFLSEGHNVTVLDNFRHGVPSLSTLMFAPGLTVVCGDARSSCTLRPLVERADIIIPLAALVGAPACEADKQYAEEINHDAVFMLAGMTTEKQLIIYPNTNSGYGIGGEALCTEGTPLSPISYYGKTKMWAEKLVLNAGGISLRFATLFGPSARMRLDLMVNDFVYRAVKEKCIVLFEGNFRRNFLHVQDAAWLFVFMAKYGYGAGCRGQAYNAGLSAANLTKRQLCVEIRKQAPDLEIIEVPFAQDPDKRDYLVSNAKVEALGWEPSHSLQDGIASLIRCYQQPFVSSQWRNY